MLNYAGDAGDVVIEAAGEGGLRRRVISVAKRGEAEGGEAGVRTAGVLTREVSRYRFASKVEGGGTQE